MMILQLPLEGACEDIENKIITSPIVVDVRSQALKDSGGCCPCKLAFEGLVVTVTDAEGTLVSTAITVEVGG